MDKKREKCFVCENEFLSNDLILNQTVMLKVCKKCKGSTAEKEREQELLDSLADDFVCGCI